MAVARATGLLRKRLHLHLGLFIIFRNNYKSAN